jgi:DNA-binding CsgD family transcriptional regulator/PAS domain-containing protein
MAVSDKRVDRLLDLIYDAATEQELWRPALTEIADRTGSQSAALLRQSAPTGQLHFCYNGRMDEACNRAYAARHIRNPVAAGMRSRHVGRIVLSDEIVPLQSLRKTLFFNEVLRPQDIAHTALVALAAKGEFMTALNLCRSARQGPLDTDGRGLIEQIVPHICRSIRLGLRVDGYSALQRAEFHVLDRLSAGVILLDGRARILYANAAARALGSDEGPLRLRNATIAAQSPSHSQRLGALVRMALLGAPEGSMSVPRPGDGSLLTILVSSVRGRDVGRFADLGMPDAGVLLFIVDPAHRAGIPLVWIMDAYGLTQAEARVALVAASGATIPEAAYRLNVSPNTVKTHLRKVFAKTGTHRQTELARLMASIGLLGAHATGGKDGS